MPSSVTLPWLKGETGDQGDPGVGVPTGGTTGQGLVKASNDPYDTAWDDVASGGGIVADTWANRPAAGTEGRLFLPTDGYDPCRDTGAAWVNQVPLGRDVSNPPAAGSFSQINFANTTLTASGDGLRLDGVGDGASGNKYKSAVVAIPGSGAYALTVGVELIYHDANFPGTGIVITDGTGASAKGHFFFIYRAGGAYSSYVQNGTHPTTFSSTPFTPVFPLRESKRFWMRIADDRTTNLTFSLSGDGVNWPTGPTYLIGSLGRTSWLTPSHIGLCRFESGVVATGAPATQMRIFDWTLA